MKKLFLILVMLVAVNASGQWVQYSSGMTGEEGISNIVANGPVMYASSMFNEGGIYYSTNYGANWELKLIASAISQSFEDVVMINNDIYTAHHSSGVFKSTNNGNNWSLISVGNYNTSFNCIAKQGTILFLGDSTVAITSNGGISWIAGNGIRSAVFSILGRDSIILAGTLDSGIYRSTNYGLSYVKSNNGLNNRYTKCFTEIGSNIYCGTSPGVYKSTNNGANWSYLSPNLNKTIWKLQSYNNSLFAATLTGVYYLKNENESWITINEGLPNDAIYAICINGDYVYIGTYHNAVWRRPLSEIVGIQNISTEIPSKYSLGQNYPNPFNPTTNVKFSILNSGNVKLVVFDVMGREVQTLVNERLQPGTYETSFDGSALNSGVYFYKLITDGFSETKKMLMIK